MVMSSIIGKIVEKIINKFNPEKVVLFGSYAWGSPEKDSDIDLFIVKDFNGRRFEELKRIRRIISEENSEAPIDVLIYKPDEVEDKILKENSFILKILKDGRILYERRD